MRTETFSVIVTVFICGLAISPAAFLPRSSFVSANSIETGQPKVDMTNEYRALRYVSESRAIPIEQLSIVAKNLLNFQLTGRKVYSARIFDGESFQDVYVDENGNIIDNVEMIEDEEQKAVSQKYGKLEPDLFDLLQTMDPDELVSCSIWSKCSPLPSFVPAEYLSPEALENAYSSYRVALENVHASAQKPVIDFLNANGFSVGYVSRYAPVISAILPKLALIELQNVPEVDTIYLVREDKPCLDIAAETVRAPSVWDQGITGQGVRVAVVEGPENPYPQPGGGRIAFANPYLSDGSWFAQDDEISSHATAVAGIIASTHSQYRGIAYEAPALLSANALGTGITWPYGVGYPAPMNEAIEWAIANGAHVINFSWGSEPVYQIDDGARYFDYVVKNSRITAVCAAGNANGPYDDWIPDGVIASPALAYNVIAVGAIDDNGTASWQDDAMAEYSSWVEPDWMNNREKPEVVAVGSRKPGTVVNEAGKKYQTEDCWLSSTLTDSPWVGTVGIGTSFAAPAVTGAAALLMQENSSLQYQPEIVKAVLMASAVHNIEGDSRLSEYDGAGAIVIPIAYETVKHNRMAGRIVDGNAFPIEYKFQAEGGQRVRATIVWSVSYSVYGGEHFNDLDLTILDPNGETVVSSTSFQNSFEIVDFRAPMSGTYTARITLSESWSGDESQYLGFAYSLVDLSTCLKYDLISFQDQLATTFTGAEKILSGNVDPWTADNMSIIPATSGPLRISFNGNDASEFMMRVILPKGGNVYGMEDLEFNADQDGDYWIYQANYYDNIALIIARGGNAGTGSYTVRLRPEYGYLSPPFKFSDVIDSGDSSWVSPYHVELRISTNPFLDPPEGGGGALLESSSTAGEDGLAFRNSGDMASNSIENSFLQVQTQVAGEWVEVGRDRDYLTYRNTLTGAYKQVIYPGPIHTWNGSGWVSYVFENRGNYCQVQHPIASARFYPDRTEFWDENFSKRLVSSEEWSVERLGNGNWSGIDFTPATISYNVVSEEEIQLVRTASSPQGTLKTTYIFKKGSPVKIPSEFTAAEGMRVRFAWRSQVEDTASHRVTKARLLDLNPDKYRGSAEGEVERDIGVSFFDGSAEPLANLGWWEEAKNENMNMVIEVEPALGKLLVRFGDFEPSSGQTAVVDPTFYSSMSDGEIYSSLYGYYAGARDAASGTVFSSDYTNATIAQDFSYPNYYSICRAFVFFDTSSLPDDAVITYATLGLYGWYDGSNRDFDIVIQSGMPTYPRDPIVPQDYNRLNYSGDGGRFNTSGWTTSGYNNITLNSTGMGWIKTTESTKFCLRSSRDIDSIAPDATLEAVRFQTSESGWGYQPKLEVMYVFGTVLQPIADAFVDYQDNPDSNFGSQTWIAINQAGGSRPESTWLKFDLSSIPSSATVTSAVFKAYAYQICWDSERSAALWDVTTNAWSESTITANNAPWGNRDSKISSDVLGSVPGWWEWDVTSWVNTYKGTTRSAWLSNDWSVGSTHYGQYYYSKEYGNIIYRPFLEVTYENNSPPSAPTSLLCEGQTNPTRVTDTTPEFSAIYNDPDVGDAAKYYRIQVDDQSNFSSPHWDSGKTSMPSVTVGNRCSDISYSGSALTRGTTYYWRIEFWDAAGNEGAWSTNPATFRLNRLPNTPSNPWPADNATNVSTSPTLSWSGGDPDGDTVTYDVYFGTSSNPPYVGSTTSTSYPRSGLAYNTTYYWKIVASDGLETSSGPVWRFTTAATPAVENAWVYWRFNNAVIDDANYDNRQPMAGSVSITGIWSFDIPRFSSDRIGQTIYWRVKAKASDGRENWSPVYVGGRLTNLTDITYQGFETGPANAPINEANWGSNQWYYKASQKHSGNFSAGAAIDTTGDDTRRLFVNVNFSGKVCTEISYWYRITSTDTVHRLMRLIGSTNSTNGQNGSWFVLRDWTDITYATSWTQFSANQNLSNFNNQSNCYIKIQVKNVSGHNQRTVYVDDFTVWTAFLS